MLILPKKKKIFYSKLSFNAVFNETASMHTGLNIGQGMGLSKNNPKDMLDFGLFGAAQAGPYNPDATAENTNPRPEDIVRVPYRFISATIVGANSWKATNFKKENVLKAAVAKLAGKTMFTDHDTSANNWVGMVGNTSYQEAYEQDGLQIPAGINGDALIDSKAATALSRALRMGALYSASVTAVFPWEASHSFETMEQFYNALGEIGKDGQMVCRVAQEITDFHEASIVWLGADPFAKTRNSDGKLRNVDKGSVHYSKANVDEKAEYETKKIFFVNDAIDSNIISLSKSVIKKTNNTPEPQPKNSTGIHMNKFLLAFLAAFGSKLSLSFQAPKEGEDLTEEQTLELTKALEKVGLVKAEAPNNTKQLEFIGKLETADADGKTAALDFTKLPEGGVVVGKAEFTRIFNDSKNAIDPKEKESLEARAKEGDQFVATKREEAIRLCKLAAGGEAPEAMLTLIKTAEGPNLEALLQQYAKEAQMQFSPTCTKCGTDANIQMRSSYQTGAKEDNAVTEEDGEGKWLDQYRNDAGFLGSYRK